MGIREENTSKVLTAIQTGIKYRGELRDLTGLHYTAINDSLDELVATGQVEKVETTMKTFYRLRGSDEQAPAPGTTPADDLSPTPPAKAAAAAAPPQGAAKKAATVKAPRKQAPARSPRAAARTPLPPVETVNASPPPFSQNGTAAALRAAAVEFEYQALWGEPSPKAETVRGMVAEAHAKA